MGLFKKRDPSRSRRTTRVWLLRIKRFGILTIGAALLLTVGVTAYRTTYFSRMGKAVSAKSLSISSKAGFKVKDILVTGRVQVPADTLLSHLSIKQGAPIFDVSIEDAQKSLADISWVKTVYISRRLPDKIIVELRERTPLALWQYQKKISVIDETGVVLTTNAGDEFSALPLIVGEDAPQGIVDLMALLRAEPEMAAQLASAIRIGGRRWDFRLKNGISVKLPEQNVELALRHLMMTEAQDNILGKDLAVIDLRIPEKLVMTPVPRLPAPADSKKDKKTAI